MADDAAKEVEAARALPFGERVRHPKWKVRNEAWSEVASTSEDPQKLVPWYAGEHAELFVIGVSDTNSAAQATALEALCAALGAAQSGEDALVSSHGAAVCKGVCSKCLSGRPNTVKRAKESLLLFAELGRGDLIVDAVVAYALPHKVSKVALAGVEALTEALRTYGSKALDVKVLLRQVPKLFDAKDVKVRGAAKELTAEFCRWIHPGVIREVLLQGAREALKKDVEALISQNEGQQVKPLKALRGEEEPAAVAGGEATAEEGVEAGAGAGAPAKEEPKIDAFDLSEPVAVLPDLAEFWSGLKEQKWSKRRDALLVLRVKASVPKIEHGDFLPVAKELKRVVSSDSNVSCVNAAIDCVDVLARGLRKSFRAPAKLLFPVLLEKYKEKSAAVTRSIHKSLGSVLEMSVSVADVQEDLVKNIKHKNPKNKVETLKLCCAALQVSREASSVAKVHDTVLKEATKATQDSSPDVREAATQLVIEFARIAGGAHAIESYLGQIDNARMSKIMRALQGSGGEEEPKPVKAATKRPTTASSKKPQAKEAKPKPTPTTSSSSSKGIPSRPIQMEGAVEELRGLFDEETFEGLKSATWKDRLQAVKDIRERAKDLCSGSEAKVDVLVAALCQVPGWGDSNFQVLLNVFEIFLDIVQGDHRVTREVAELMVAGCVEKIADAKLNAKVCDLLDKCAAAVNQELLVMKVLGKSKSHRNPKVLLESLEWVSNSLARTSARRVDPKTLIEATKLHLGHSNPNIRLAATNVLAMVIACRGLENKSYLGEVKPTVMANIDATVADLRANKGITPASPKKTPSRKGTGAREVVVEVEEEAALDAVDSQLPSGVLDRLGDTNWKTRRAALDELKQVARTRKDAVRANVSGIIGALRLRLHDANKNLIIVTLEILQHLPSSFDAKLWERHGKIIIADVLRVLCDNKKAVREAGCLTLHTWTDKFALKSMQTYLVGFVSDAKTNVDGKVSVLSFLSEVADESALQLEDCLQDALSIVADCLLGKALSLREAATALLKSLVEVFQVEKVKEQMASCTKAHQECLVACLTKLGHIAPPAGSEAKRPRTSLSRRSSQGARAARPATAGARVTPSSTPKAAPKAVAEADAFAENGDKAERARKGRKRSAVSKPLVEDLQRPETLRTLESCLAQHCTQNLRSLLFHTDFKKHCAAVEVIASLVEDESSLQGVLDNLDLVLQWFAIRICEGNMQVLVKILDCVGGLADALKARGHSVTDYEAGCLLPCLVEKCGHNIDRIRQSYRELLTKLADVYSPKPLVLSLLQGTSSKNHRTKVVCVEVLEALYASHDSEFHSSKIIKEVASLLQERDVTLKNKALALLSAVYQNVGAGIWRYLSSVPEPVKATLEAKFKTLEPVAAASRTPGSAKRPGTAPAAPRTPSSERATPTSSLKFRASPARRGPADEAAATWSRSMKRAASDDLSESVEGMKQLCHVLLDFAKKTSDLDVTVLVGSSDKLVYELSEKVSVIFSKAIKDMQESASRVPEPGSSRGCKYVLNTLMHSFQLSPMAAAVSEPTLRKIMKNLLMLLLNQTVPALEEGGQLLKALNVLMLKILENANRTSTFLSLLWLLGEGRAVEDQGLRTKFSDLTIKCCIKCVKNLETSIEEGLQVEAVLVGVNAFLGSLERGEMRERLRSDDKPLRMVKTVINELCKIKGKGVYESMVSIPRKEGSLLYTYVDLYSSMANKTSAATANAAQARREELASIFEKIGEGDGAGLQLLYKFTLSHPRVSIDGHLSKTSESFQRYIKDGLAACARQSDLNKENRSEGGEEAAGKQVPAEPRRTSYSIEELRQRVERAKALLNK